MSKEVFFQMRAEEMAQMYDATFTKKEAKKQGVQLVKNVLENGNVTLHDLMANIVRLKEVVNSAESELRKNLPEEEVEIMGVKFSPKNGGNTINFKDDEVWSNLKNKLKNREDLLKTALKNDEAIYDNEGVEVPKVSKTPRKDSITITF